MLQNLPTTPQISSSNENPKFSISLDLQCIADMKKECDANGLEYELLMQESAKERFLRDINNNSLDFNKHLVILKQKRQSATSTTEQTVGAAAPAPAPEDPSVGSANSLDVEENRVGNPLALVVNSFNIKSPIGGGAALAGGGSGLAGAKSALAGVAAPKLLYILRERLAEIKAAPAIKAPAPFVLPAVTTAEPVKQKFSLPSIAPFDFKNLVPKSSGGPVVQPSWL